jgi:hypothetical protein
MLGCKITLLLLQISRFLLVRIDLCRFQFEFIGELLDLGFGLGIGVFSCFVVVDLGVC